jgi:hypothetical protein
MLCAGVYLEASKTSLAVAVRHEHVVSPRPHAYYSVFTQEYQRWSSLTVLAVLDADGCYLSTSLWCYSSSCIQQWCCRCCICVSQDVNSLGRLAMSEMSYAWNAHSCMSDGTPNNRDQIQREMNLERRSVVTKSRWKRMRSGRAEGQRQSGHERNSIRDTPALCDWT